jgi:hypothetical protein
MLYDPNWTPPEVKLKPWQETINRAIDLIEVCGWRQRTYGDTYHGFCIIGALRGAGYASSGLDDAHTRIEAISHICEAIGSDDVTGWNDMLNRTKEQVISKMREAITNVI